MVLWGASPCSDSFFLCCVFCGFGLIYTHVGGHGIKTRCARAIFFLAIRSLGSKYLLRFFSLRVLRFWSNKYACWRLRVQHPMCTCDYISLLLVLWGASQCARKKAGYVRPHWRRLSVWGFAAGRLFFFFIFCRCVYCGFGIIHTPVGGHGFKIRGARAIIFLGFWCFEDQATARAKRRVVCGRTGGGCEFRGLPRVACFSFFLIRVFAVLV